MERNLAAKLPAKVATFRLLVSRCLHVVADPTAEELTPFAGQADPKDLPIFVAAVLSGCSHLVTINVRHYQPVNGPTIQTPGEFLRGLRDRLASLGA